MATNTSKPPKVLIVSNRQTKESKWAFSLQERLINVVLESDPANTLSRWEKEVPDLVILDVDLPEEDTLQLINDLRAETIVPVLLFLPAGTEEFVLRTYEAGVDDCILEPVSPSFIDAKLKVWLRRSMSVPTSALGPVKIGKLHLMPSDRKVQVEDAEPVRITNLEFRLLYYLMNHPGYTVSIEELNQRVWGYLHETDNTMLKNVVYRLRRKIEAEPAAPKIIETVAGVGYKLALE